MWDLGRRGRRIAALARDRTLREARDATVGRALPALDLVADAHAYTDRESAVRDHGAVPRPETIDRRPVASRPCVSESEKQSRLEPKSGDGSSAASLRRAYGAAAETCGARTL